MMRLKSDLLRCLIMSAEGRFSEMPPLEWDPRTALVVVLAAKGSNPALPPARVPAPCVL